MIVAFSTSSPQSSVALLSPSGELIGAAETHAPMGASGACLNLLETLLQRQGLALNQATLFASDLGPGSFTGVKVGVTLAKTFAFVQGVQVIGAESFDLIDPDHTVVFPSKKNEYFVRRIGQELIRTPELPDEKMVGFGPDLPEQIYPHAANFARLLSRLTPQSPLEFVPSYRIEPSISTPKKRI